MSEPVYFTEKCICGAIISINVVELTQISQTSDGRRAREHQKTCESCKRVHTFTLTRRESEPTTVDEGDPEIANIVIFFKNTPSYITFQMRLRDALNYTRDNLIGKIGVTRGFGTIYDTQRPGTILGQFAYEEVLSFRIYKMKRNELGKLVSAEEAE